MLVGAASPLDSGQGSAIPGRVPPAIAHIALDFVELGGVGQEDLHRSLDERIVLTGRLGPHLGVELVHEGPAAKVEVGTVWLQLRLLDVGMLSRQFVDVLRGNVSQFVNELDGGLLLGLLIVASLPDFRGELWDPLGNRDLVAGEGVLLLELLGDFVSTLHQHSAGVASFTLGVVHDYLRLLVSAVRALQRYLRVHELVEPQPLFRRDLVVRAVLADVNYRILLDAHEFHHGSFACAQADAGEGLSDLLLDELGQLVVVVGVVSHGVVRSGAAVAAVNRGGVDCQGVLLRRLLRILLRRLLRRLELLQLNLVLLQLSLELPHVPCLLRALSLEVLAQPSVVLLAGLDHALLVLVFGSGAQPPAICGDIVVRVVVFASDHLAKVGLLGEAVSGLPLRVKPVLGDDPVDVLRRHVGVGVGVVVEKVGVF